MDNLIVHEGLRGECEDLREHKVVQKNKEKFHMRLHEAVAKSIA